MERSEMCFDWDHDPRHMTKGFGWRSAASVLTGVLWLSFIIIWLFFFAGDYSVWENLGVLLLSVVVLAGVNATFWASLGLRMARDCEAVPWWRVAATCLLALGAVAFAVVWLMVLADGYNVYQNLAVLFVNMLICGGLCGVIWMGYDS